MSIKTSADEWVRKGPTQAIAVIAAAALLIGGVVGVGVGYKIEQSRTRSDVNRLKAQIKAGGGGTPSATLGQRAGSVTASASGSISLTTKKRGAQVLLTTASTVYEKAVKGSVGDVQSGRRILVTPGGAEIIVLAQSSQLGRVVSAVGRESITIANADGKTAATIKTADVKTVYKLQPGTAADVKKGVDMLAGGKSKSQKDFDASEIILLPAGSAFLK